MAKVKCDAKVGGVDIVPCKHNQHGICQAEEIEICNFGMFTEYISCPYCPREEGRENSNSTVGQ